MKRFGFVLFLVAALTGCSSPDSPVERVREQVTGDYPTRTRQFAADERATWQAAKAVLVRMGYRITHGGPAQRFLDATSPIDSGEHPGTLHQILVHADFAATLDGKGTDVTLRLSETTADDDSGRLSHGVEGPLRGTPLYEVIFRDIESGLTH